MKRKVNISLISKQYDGENTEQLELLTEGELKISENSYELSYQESEATGFDNCVTTLTVKDNNTVMLTRSGDAGSDLVIEMGKKHHCLYGTPFGDMMVGVTAKKVDSDMTKDGGRLNFSYSLDINASYVGDFEIKIGVKKIN